MAHPPPPGLTAPARSDRTMSAATSRKSRVAVGRPLEGDAEHDLPMKEGVGSKMDVYPTKSSSVATPWSRAASQDGLAECDRLEIIAAGDVRLRACFEGVKQSAHGAR